MTVCAKDAKLQRTTFRTSRLLDFCSRKELIAQTGHRPEAWPLVMVKELLDNALDACEDAGIAPRINVRVNGDAITVADNGPGIPADTVAGVLDFSVRVSSREAYVSPSRGAQGNALKTVVAMPFVLSGERGRVDITARGVCHEITLEVDRVRQTPVVSHEPRPAPKAKIGTVVRVHWPDSASSNLPSRDPDFLQNEGEAEDADRDSASSMLARAKSRFLQIADDYTFLNPHLTLAVDWFGEHGIVKASDRSWRKWLSSDPTCPHWYRPEHLERLVAAYVAHDADAGNDRTVRELVAEFRGLSATAKQKAVLETTGLSRTNLSQLANGHGIDRDVISRLLSAMQEHTKPVKPKQLGVIGKDHLAARFELLGCEMKSFQYKKVLGETGLPWVIETAFGWCPNSESRRIVTGVNWSPGIVNPFRELGKFGQSLDSLLEQQRAGRDEPIVLVLHIACPRVEYADRGKSAVVIEE